MSVASIGGNSGNIASLIQAQRQAQLQGQAKNPAQAKATGEKDADGDSDGTTTLQAAQQRSGGAVDVNG